MPGRIRRVRTGRPGSDVDPAVLVAAFAVDDGDDYELGERAAVALGPVEPSVLVPARVPGLEDMAPGQVLAGVLDGVDLPGLGAYELVEAVAGWQRIASWAAARQAEVVAELAGRVEMRPTANRREIPSMTPQRVTGLEVAARLRLTPGTSEALVARSVCLVRMLPATGPRWPRVASTPDEPRWSPTSWAGTRPRSRGRSRRRFSTVPTS